MLYFWIASVVSLSRNDMGWDSITMTRGVDSLAMTKKRGGDSLTMTWGGIPSQ
ncbi:hypothetical protein [Helicobacter sp. MIT 99-5507]|uniref:hypothetical protein n=1 Tax=Helicobacter sp. MIT 99-5507 TaxID=152489 RepID=UPI0015F1544B|nr:hypothetical protein [Helicobacter sp. MIT 99-5507]